MSGTPQAAHAAAEAAVRGAYGRLLAWLAWKWRDIAAAEDALADALLAALATWPRDGIPASPEGWLMTAARRNLMKADRHRRVIEDPAVRVLLPHEATEAPAAPALPDSRLRLMFVCAHPAIDAGVRSALMLQTVLGLDSARIARAWLVSPEAMTKRLVRAKAKIKATGLRFEPEPAEWPARLSAVLEAVYGAYTLDWDAEDGTPSGEDDLAAEARYLAELTAALVPDDAEAAGLAALLSVSESRRDARNDTRGTLVPLHEQDVLRWDARLIERAEAHLARAAALGRPGPFQIEAAIQVAHASRRHSGTTPWADIAALYERLIATHPTLGARIGHALAVAYALGDAAAGLARLHAIEASQRTTFQPWWAALAHLLERAGETEAAMHAYEEAICGARSALLRRTLLERQRALGGALQ